MLFLYFRSLKVEMAPHTFENWNSKFQTRIRNFKIWENGILLSDSSVFQLQVL